jgi:hypothetical protein
MAQVVAMIDLFERMSCTNGDAQVLVNEQGIDSLDELCLLTDKEIDHLFKLVRSPGGQIPNPNAAGAGHPALIPATDHSCSMVATRNVKLAANLVRHCVRTSRPCVQDMSILFEFAS